MYENIFQAERSSQQNIHQSSFQFQVLQFGLQLKTENIDLYSQMSHPEKPCINQKKKQSDHLEQYLQYFQDIQSQVNNIIINCQQNKEYQQEHKIVILSQLINHEFSYKHPQILILNDQQTGRLIEYQITIARYKMYMTLINLHMNAPKNLNKIGSGGYGSIYKVCVQQQMKSIVIKRKYLSQFYQSFLIQQTKKWQIKNNKAQIEQALSEYAFYKICSFYKLGPKVCTSLGFDLVCFEDCIEFYMQYCLSPSTYNQNGIKELKICIRVMHKLKLIHKDMKPFNILYSFEYNKFVLSDFGISHPIEENLGQLSKTYQQGSIGYMCEQMNTISSNCMGDVDLYYNDLYGLQQIINYFGMYYKKTEQMTQRIKKDKKVNEIYQIIYIYSLLVHKKEAEALDQLKKINQNYIKSVEFSKILRNQNIHHIFIKAINKLRKNLLLNVTIEINQNKQIRQKRDIQRLVRNYGFTDRLIVRCGTFSNPYIQIVVNHIKHQNQYKKLPKTTTKRSKKVNLTAMKLIYKQISNLENLELVTHRSSNLTTKIIQLYLELYILVLRDQKGYFKQLRKKIFQRLNAIEKKEYTLKYTALFRLEILQLKFSKVNYDKSLQFITKYGKNDPILFEILFLICLKNKRFARCQNILKYIFPQYIRSQKIHKFRILLDKSYNHQIILFKRIYYTDQAQFNMFIQFISRNQTLDGFLRFLNQIKNTIGEFHILFAQVLYHIGQMYELEQNYDEAEKYYMDGYNICKILQQIPASLINMKKVCEILFMKDQRQAFIEKYLLYLMDFVKIYYTEWFQLNQIDLLLNIAQIKNQVLLVQNVYIRQPKLYKSCQKFIIYFRHLIIYQSSQQTLLKVFRNKAESPIQKSIVFYIQNFQKELNELLIEYLVTEVKLLQNIDENESEQSKILLRPLHYIQNFSKLGMNKITEYQMYRIFSRTFQKFKLSRKSLVYAQRMIFIARDLIQQVSFLENNKSQILNYYQRLSQDAFNNQNYKKCIYYTKSMLTLIPNCPKAYQLYKRMSQLYFNIKHYKNYWIYFLKFMQLRPKNSVKVIYEGLAQMYCKIHRLDYFAIIQQLSIKNLNNTVNMEVPKSDILSQHQQYCRKILTRKLEMASEKQSINALKICKRMIKISRVIPLRKVLRMNEVNEINTFQKSLTKHFG